MFPMIVILSFCIFLIVYGYGVLAGHDWITKVREFSARMEGSGNLKRDADAMQPRLFGIVALVFGIIGAVMSVATTVVLFFV